jgi:hypothetical protein
MDKNKLKALLLIFVGFSLIAVFAINLFGSYYRTQKSIKRLDAAQNYFTSEDYENMAEMMRILVPTFLPDERLDEAKELYKLSALYSLEKAQKQIVKNDELEADVSIWLAERYEESYNKLGGNEKLVPHWAREWSKNLTYNKSK